MAKPSRGGQRKRGGTIKGNYNINDKKWKPRERTNLDESLKWMEKQFGDISDATGEIKKKYMRGAEGMHEHGFDLFGHVTPRQTLFNTDSFIGTDTFVHEFTHAVAEEMANNAKVLGFKSSEEFYDRLRTESYARAGLPEPKYDGRKWADRAVEFPAIQVQNKYLGGTPLSESALATLKQYWKRYKRARK